MPHVGRVLVGTVMLLLAGCLPSAPHLHPVEGSDGH
jgi:hypothetical protein